MAAPLRRALRLASVATPSSLPTATATATASARASASASSASASRHQLYATASQHCVTLVQRSDHDGYSATLMAPSSVRMPMLTLRAFQAEVAAIPTQQKIAAQLRYQWWRNVVMECAAKRTPPPSSSSSSSTSVPSPPNSVPVLSAQQQQQTTIGSASSSHHPVVTMLGAVMTRYAINPSWLLTMIDAKEHVSLVNTDAARTITELYEYGDAWTGSLYQTLLEVNGVTDSNAARHAAYHLGRAVSLCSLLRWVPAHAAQRKCYLPTDLMQHVTHSNLYQMHFR